LDREVLAQLGLSVEDVRHQADAFVRIPENAEAIFRAASNAMAFPSPTFFRYGSMFPTIRHTAKNHCPESSVATIGWEGRMTSTGADLQAFASWLWE
jgi:hypothetical protein